MTGTQWENLPSSLLSVWPLYRNVWMNTKLLHQTEDNQCRSKATHLDPVTLGKRGVEPLALPGVPWWKREAATTSSGVKQNGKVTQMLSLPCHPSGSQCTTRALKGMPSLHAIVSPSVTWMDTFYVNKNHCSSWCCHLPPSVHLCQNCRKWWGRVLPAWSSSTLTEGPGD